MKIIVYDKSQDRVYKVTDTPEIRALINAAVAEVGKPSSGDRPLWPEDQTEFNRANWPSLTALEDILKNSEECPHVGIYDVGAIAIITTEF